MRLRNYLSHLWSRWRNLDRLAAAHRATKEAQCAAIEAQCAAEASREQLAVGRAMLAVTMRERDHLEAALQRVAGDLARLKAKQRHELRASRLWVTRCRATNVSQN